MKTAIRPVLGLPLVLLLGASVLAQDAPTIQSPQIVGPLRDGTSPPAPEPKVLPALRVLDSHVHRRGGRSVIIQKVDAPERGARIQAVEAPQIDLQDPQVQAWIQQQQQLQQEAKEHRFTIVSATVFDHAMTRLQWWVYRDDGPPEKFEGYSNIDWNHLAGFSSFEVGNVRYSLLMGIGNADTEAQRRLARERGVQYEAPEFPDLSGEADSYIVTEGDTASTRATAVMDGLHELYRAEKVRLKSAYESREQARMEREAYLKANPPRPKDIVIRYSLGTRPRPESQEAQQEGGAQ